MKKITPVSVLIIGGGFAGLATADALCRMGIRGVRVIEQDARLGGHSSGRNAGMIRQAVADPAIAALAKESRAGLAALEKKGWGRLGFKANGSLLLGENKNRGELARIAKTLRGCRIPFKWWTKSGALRRVPVLAGADFQKALFCPSDAFIDIQALIKGFVRQLRSRGVRVDCRMRVQEIRRVPGGFRVKAGKKNFHARKIVNAAGAWAQSIGELAGARPIRFYAYRRHLYRSRRCPFKASGWPFVWDLTHEFYFRPQESGLLLSPCDKTLFRLKAGDAAGVAETPDPKINRLMRKKLENFSPIFSKLSVEPQKAGLRTMAQDGRFVIGGDGRLNGFFWVAGLGGHGVTTSLAVGRLAALHVAGQKVPPYFVRAFGPGRFFKK